jgi:hypothetical protein
MQPHSKSNHLVNSAHFVPADLVRKASFFTSTFHARTIAAASVLGGWVLRWRSSSGEELHWRRMPDTVNREKGG